MNDVIERITRRIEHFQRIHDRSTYWDTRAACRSVIEELEAVRADLNALALA